MIYADYNGSAPICGEVKKYLLKRLESGPYANPNAIHHLGQKVLMGMENARSLCAKVLGADYNQIIFNSGATEGLASVFHSVMWDAKKTNKTKFITTGIEHSAIHNLASFYKEEGFSYRHIPLVDNGTFDLKTLEAWLKEDHKELAMVTAMAANNETGIIQPYKEIAALCQKYGVPYLCDSTQIIGKDHFNFKESGADYAVLSGHKIGALTGSGLLMAKDPTKLHPMIIGGGQEKGYRGGTQNYLGNETLAVALNDMKGKLERINLMREARDLFEEKIQKEFPMTVIIGKNSPRLATTTYIAYPGIHGQAVQIELESEDIFVTTSSACSDNQPVTSKVLKAMNVEDDIGRGVVRISLGLCSEPNSYDKIYEGLKKAYNKLAKIKSY
jgi:cysteine desulfurase